MATPKRKTSRSKKNMRSSSQRRPVTAVQACPECGESRQPHRVCTSCGMYKGRQVLTIKTED